jgi:hypothetical protein
MCPPLNLDVPTTGLAHVEVMYADATHQAKLDEK